MADGDDENASARKRFMLKPTTKNALIDWMIEVKMVKHEKPNQEEAKKDIRRKASDLLKEKRMDATREHFVFDLLDEYHQHHQTEANDKEKENAVVKSWTNRLSIPSILSAKPLMK